MDIEARRRVADLVRAIDETTPDADPPIMQPDEFIARLTDACIIAGIEPATDDPVPLYHALNRWLDDTRPAYLKQLRQDRGLLYRDIRDTIGITKSVLEKWEQGVRPIRGASAYTVHRLATLYGLTSADLLY